MTMAGPLAKAALGEPLLNPFSRAGGGQNQALQARLWQLLSPPPICWQRCGVSCAQCLGGGGGPCPLPPL